LTYDWSSANQKLAANMTKNILPLIGFIKNASKYKNSYDYYDLGITAGQLMSILVQYQTE